MAISFRLFSYRNFLKELKFDIGLSHFHVLTLPGSRVELRNRGASQSKRWSQEDAQTPHSMKSSPKDPAGQAQGRGEVWQHPGEGPEQGQLISVGLKGMALGSFGNGSG